MIYLLLLPLGYLAICALLYFRQESMMFFPTAHEEGELLRRAEREGFEPWRNAKGEQIGWQSKDGNTDEVLLVFNGNGGCALDRAYYRDITRQKGDWKTFLLEYPGYGTRSGKPSENTLTAAGVEAVDLLEGKRIWLVGESMGSGTACAVVRERGDAISGVLLATPFNSLVAAASGHYPWLPVSLLMRTRFESDKNLEKYTGPVAFFLSANDRTVPAALGKKLHDGYRGPKRLWVQEDGHHDVSGILEREWPQVVEWLQSGGK